MNISKYSCTNEHLMFCDDGRTNTGLDRIKRTKTGYFVRILTLSDLAIYEYILRLFLTLNKKNQRHYKYNCVWDLGQFHNFRSMTVEYVVGSFICVCTATGMKHFQSKHNNQKNKNNLFHNRMVK
jgi:hypothetical protein